MRRKFFQQTTEANDLPGLESLDDRGRALVLAKGRVVRIPGGWTPIHRHVPSDEAYLVLEGQMGVHDDENHVADIGPGEFAGEMGLVDHALRNARVTTEGDVVALAFPGPDFQALRRELPEFDAIVTESTARRHGRR